MAIVYHMVPCVARYLFWCGSAFLALGIGGPKGGVNLLKSKELSDGGAMGGSETAAPATAKIPFKDFSANAREPGRPALARGTYYTAGDLYSRRLCHRSAGEASTPLALAA